MGREGYLLEASPPIPWRSCFRMNRKFLLVQVFSLVCLSFPATAVDWPTFAHDPQRSGWAFEETTLAADNISQLELKWTAQVKNEPRSLTALTAPLIASEVNTPQGT